MAIASIERVSAVVSDTGHGPVAFLVLGTATRPEGLIVRFLAPDDPIVEQVQCDVDETCIPPNIHVPRGKILWCARFTVDLHEALRQLNCGAQERPLVLSLSTCPRAGEEPRLLCQASFSSIEHDEHVCDEHVYDAGVLFVHGIGHHARGDTLVRFGEPIISFIQSWFDGVKFKWLAAWSINEAIRWCEQKQEGLSLARPSDARTFATIEAFRHLANASGSSEKSVRRSEVTPPPVLLGDVAVEDAVLSATRPDNPNAPAHATIRLSLFNRTGQLDERRLMFAESWWTNTISAPTFRELFTCGFGIIPMMFAAQAAVPVCRAVLKFTERVKQKSWPSFSIIMSILMGFIYLLAALVAAMPVELLVFLLFLLGIFPIPRLRELIIKAQLNLVGSIGQSYLLASSPMRFSAMIGQVSNDLNWLCKRCRKVLIVAHSQGAALVNYALRKTAPRELTELITLGSGLNQLSLLLEEERYRAFPLNERMSTSIKLAAWSSIFGKIMIFSYIVSRTIYYEELLAYNPLLPVLDRYIPKLA
jgi:hypothetical protein